MEYFIHTHTAEYTCKPKPFMTSLTFYFKYTELNYLPLIDVNETITALSIRLEYLTQRKNKRRNAKTDCIC